jgi:outer membrane protein insertion porin family
VFGLGYSQLSGLTTQVQLSQENFLGTGNRVSVQAQRSRYQSRYDFSFLNPYFLDNGLSLGYNLWWRELDYSDFGTAQYSSNSGAGQVVLGFPITETDTITGLFGIDSNQILDSSSTPEPIRDYIAALNTRTFHAWRAELGWSRNSLDNLLTPSRGMQQRIWLESTLPGSTVEYFKLNYSISKFWPLSRHLVLNTRAELGYGDSYGDSTTRNICFTANRWEDTNDNDKIDEGEIIVTPPTDPCLNTSPDFRKTVTADGLPFFENFYAGGVRSVRGFRDNTLGPRQAPSAGSTYLQPVGGAVKTTGSLEMYFPTLLDTPAARASAFIDFGNVYKDLDTWDAGELRASTGLALMWRSPMGPISISYAFPLRQEDDDELERLQFTFGGTF